MSMRKASVWGTLALVVACGGAGIAAKEYARGKPMIRACESFIASGLKSPATYSRVGVTEVDVPITKAEFRTSVGRSFYNLRLATHDALPTTVHAVIIESDAENSFGTPIRDKTECVFSLGDTGWFSDVSQELDHAKMQQMNRQLITSGLLKDDGRTDLNPAYPCCLM